MTGTSAASAGLVSISATLVSLLMLGTGADAAFLRIEDASGVPGETVQFSVLLDTEGEEVFAVSSDLRFDPTLPVASTDRFADCARDPEDRGGGTFRFVPFFCSPGVDCEILRADVPHPFSGFAPMDDGVLFRCDYPLPTDVLPGTVLPIDFEIVTVANEVLRRFPVDATRASSGGVIRVIAPQPTPTPTLPVPLCVADCNRDRIVGVDELVVCIGIAGGNLLLDGCPACNIDENPDVDIHELVTGVTHAVRGCPAPQVTSTPTQPTKAPATTTPTPTPRERLVVSGVVATDLEDCGRAFPKPIGFVALTPPGATTETSLLFPGHFVFHDVSPGEHIVAIQPTCRFETCWEDVVVNVVDEDVFVRLCPFPASPTPTATATETPTPGPFCGDGVVNGEEECDGPDGARCGPNDACLCCLCLGDGEELGTRTFTIERPPTTMPSSLLGGGDILLGLDVLPGPILLHAGRPEPEVAGGPSCSVPLTIEQDVVLGFPLPVGQTLCTKLFAEGSAGTLDCDGSGARNIEYSIDSNGPDEASPPEIRTGLGECCATTTGEMCAEPPVLCDPSSEPAECPGLYPSCNSVRSATGQATIIATRSLSVLLSSADLSDCACLDTVDDSAGALAACPGLFREAVLDTPLAFTTATATGRVVNPTQGGRPPEIAATGQAFPCTDWARPNGPGIIVAPLPLLDHLLGDAVNILSLASASDESMTP